MADTDPPPILPGLPALELRLIHPDERPRFDQLLCDQHYLHNATIVGETVRYVAVAPDGRWLALLAWSSPALHLRPRDRWIGWSEPQRAARLRLVAQNSRFLILAERAHYPNLASHLLATILTIAAVATVAGERGPKGFAKFAALLSQPQRRHLRCVPHKKTGQLIVPSEPTFRRAFKRLDRAQLHELLAAWLAEHDPEKLTALAVDGKTVKGSRQSDGRPVHLMSAIAHHSQRLLNQIPVAEKSNEIPAFRPLLEPLPLAGTLTTADAEHCQRAHAQFLVYEKGGDYLFLAKGNQPTLEALAQSKLPGGLPPLG